MSSDEKADEAIKVMVATVVGTAFSPAFVNWAITATLMGSGVIAIGLCYGVKITADEAWKLIKQFMMAAGFWFLCMNVGTKLISALLSSTGIGHVGAIMIDGFTSAAFAYSIGAAAKAYFKGTKNNKELGEIVRKAFNSKIKK